MRCGHWPRWRKPGRARAAPALQDIALVNGRIHTMDRARRVVSQVLIRNGRFAAVGDRVPRRDARVIDLKGRTVIPGIVDAHDHIVLVGNRPGWHVLAEDVFTVPEAVARYQAKAASVPAGEFITTIGPMAAMQFREQRLPTLAELDAVTRPVYINAAQGGVRTNSLGKAWLEKQGVTVAADGAIAPNATGATAALKLLREQFLTPESRKRTAFEAMTYYAGLGITTHLDDGAFHSELPSGGVANENTYTMHQPFLALAAEQRLPARLRFNYLHQDPPADPSLPTLAPRLRNSLPFFGNDWIRSGGIGEFTGGGVNGLRAIAAAGWRAEDHTLNLASFQSLVESREKVHADIPLTTLRWVISHVPADHAGAGQPLQGDRRRVAGRLGAAAHGQRRRARLPHALRQRHPARLPLRRRRHHGDQSVAQLLHDDHRKEPEGRRRQRGPDADARRDLVAGHGGQ